MVQEIEKASRLQATGLIDNTNLGSATTPEDRLHGRKVLPPGRVAGVASGLAHLINMPTGNGEDQVPYLPLTYICVLNGWSKPVLNNRKEGWLWPRLFLMPNAAKVVSYVSLFARGVSFACRIL